MSLDAVFVGTGGGSDCRGMDSDLDREWIRLVGLGRLGHFLYALVAADRVARGWTKGGLINVCEE